MIRECPAKAYASMLARMVFMAGCRSHLLRRTVSNAGPGLVITMSVKRQGNMHVLRVRVCDRFCLPLVVSTILRMMQSMDRIRSRGLADRRTARAMHLLTGEFQHSPGLSLAKAWAAIRIR